MLVLFYCMLLCLSLFLTLFVNCDISVSSWPHMNPKVSLRAFNDCLWEPRAQVDSVSPSSWRHTGLGREHTLPKAGDSCWDCTKWLWKSPPGEAMFSWTEYFQSLLWCHPNTFSNLWKTVFHLLRFFSQELFFPVLLHALHCSCFLLIAELWLSPLWPTHAHWLQGKFPSSLEYLHEEVLSTKLGFFLFVQSYLLLFFLSRNIGEDLSRADGAVSSLLIRKEYFLEAWRWQMLWAWCWCRVTGTQLSAPCESLLSIYNLPGRCQSCHTQRDRVTELVGPASGSVALHGSSFLVLALAYLSSFFF